MKIRDERGRALGAVKTPPDLVEFMVSLCHPTKSRCRVLEPGCGDCPFLLAFAQRYGFHHELVGIDIDPEAVRAAKRNMPTATIIEGDFLLWEPDGRFDIIIGNPPYGIIGDGSHYPIHSLKEKKGIYRNRFWTWQGKFNIYGAFIEQAVKLLNEGGKLVFVVPASWMVLDDFAKLRLFLAHSGHLTIYYFGRVFSDRRVSCVVMTLEKGRKGISLHDGLSPVSRRTDYAGELIRFETPEWLAFEKSGPPLECFFHIHFAARSPEVRAHPLVSTTPKSSLVPVLTGRNLKSGWIDYQNCYSGLWMPQEAAPTLRFFYAFPHIVVGHTKGTRVVAAVDDRCYPWREEFHLVAKADGLDERAIAAYLNSEVVQDYVRSLYRDLVPHLTLPMLSRIPIPQEFIPTHRLSLFAQEN
ncbi:MAG: methyltransferase domain-containing protein [Armatimonadetes bacterium]|nr:methyltransferase domain-containing protein [Armatimonadota bacterium]MDW8121732.1 TaqI-like C-terminal specificity domain-containing protein [Armatimonadota bacterium]